MECPDCKGKIRLMDFDFVVAHGDVEIKSKCPGCSRKDEYYVPADFYFGIKE